MTNENDWVTQDVVPRRVAIDEYRWITKQGYASSWGMTLLSPKDKKELSHGHIDEYGSRLEVRCKRKDHPFYKVIPPVFVSQDELNAAPKTRAWTFGTPAQTGHFLICYSDPAIVPQDIHAVTLTSQESYGFSLWFIYLGQTSDFADPVIPKAKYTLMMDPNEPRAKWLRRPDEIQDRLNAGWTIVTEREFEVPEWDR
jgi:hypothetical protein